MALPTSVQAEPLLRYMNIQELTDADFRTLLRDAAKEAESIVARSGDVRRAQLDLARHQQALWRSVGDSTRVAIGDGVDGAADSLSYLNEIMLNGTGSGSTYWRHSMLAQARQGINSFISRGANGVPLAESVYRGRAWSNDLINRKINGLLLAGASAREIATSVSGLINPAVPGGVSYAAMRLGRSELNNAFHSTSVRLASEQPWVQGMKWNLSSSHPEGDICDDYAYKVHWRGHDQGVFKTSDVPGKPHPQCFCYVTPVVDSDAAIAKRFANGEYDDYVGSMGCGIV